MQKLLELDFKEIRHELQSTDFVRSSTVLGRVNDIFGTKEHGYHRIDDHSFLHVMNFEAGQSYSLTMERRNLVCIQIVIKGTYLRRIGDRVDVVDGTMIQISNTPRSTSDTSRKTRLRGLLIACDRQHLIDRYGLNVDRVPAGYGPIFLSSNGMAVSFKLPTSLTITIPADQIISCKYGEPLRSLYIKSKAVEIICAVVSEINSCSLRKTLRIRSDRSKIQAIEAAATIYRNEIHNSPTIEQLSFRVGLNRNQLTSGFRELFGITPHAYANVVRMEEARELLLKGQLSVSEIARRVGYEGYSSFSRAYSAHFGHAPSVEDDAT